MSKETIKKAEEQMKAEKESDIQAYYAGKDDRYLQEDNLMFKKVNMLHDILTAPRKVWRRGIADALLILVVQGSTIKSMLRRLNDKLDAK